MCEKCFESTVRSFIKEDTVLMQDEVMEGFHIRHALRPGHGKYVMSRWSKEVDNTVFRPKLEKAYRRFTLMLHEGKTMDVFRIEVHEDG